MAFLMVRCVVLPLNFRGHWGALIVQLEEGTAHAPLLLYATLIGIKLIAAFFYSASFALSSCNCRS